MLDYGEFVAIAPGGWECPFCAEVVAQDWIDIHHCANEPSMIVSDEFGEE